MDTGEARQLLACEGTTERQQMLAALFEQYRPRLRAALAYRMNGRLRRRVGPGDVIQETYLEALARVDEYCGKPDLPLYPWIRLLALQKLHQLQRHHVGAQKRDVRREVPLADSSAGTFAPAPQEAGADTPSQIAMRAEREDIFFHVLERLDPEDRELILLRNFEKVSWAEAAAILGNGDETTLRKRYSRALVKLKGALRKASRDRSWFWKA